MNNRAAILFNKGNPDQTFRVTSTSENPFATYSNFNPDFAPLSIVTIVGKNSSFYNADLAYLAAIPITLYHENGILKVSPLLFDEVSLATQNFLSDWKNYCKKFDSWNGIKNVVYIGDVSTSVKTQVENLLNPEMLRSPSIQGQSERVQMMGQNIFGLTAQIATYFWFQPETAIVVPIAETFPEPQSIGWNYTGILTGVQSVNRTGAINQTHLLESWSSTDLQINSGALFVQINTTNNLAMQLFGNYSTATPWMYDTNVLSQNAWIFFPNVSYPADLSDWGLEIVNSSKLSGSINYNIAFSNLTYQSHQFEITNSESQCRLVLNWNDSNIDMKMWVLDPTGQLVGANSRKLFEFGRTNGSSTIIYPKRGNWTVIVTRTHGIAPVQYNLTINITNYSSYKRQYIESASNGAILASLLNKPMLYVTNESVPAETQQALATLNVSTILQVDPFNLMGLNVTQKLNQTGNVISIQNLTSRTKLYDYIYNISQQTDLVLASMNEGYYAPASLLAAFHGAPLLPTYNETYNIHARALKNYAIDSWIGFQNPGNSGLLNQSIPRFEDMKGLADEFYTWLGSWNLDRSGNESVLIVAPTWELSPFFDRAIYGKALAGRFAALDSTELAISICRNIFYPALSYVNLPYDYVLTTKLASVEGNSTITSTQLIATGFSGDSADCASDDGVYHSYYNGSNGQIVMAYYSNLSNSKILFENISTVEIALDGKISYANESIQTAGWGIWNWTAGSIVLVNSQSLNATSDQFDTFLIASVNKNSFINPINSRIEIFVVVNTTGPPVATSIDFIQFNITYYHLQNRPKMLSSSVSYWHNFTFQGSSYNYSTQIPSSFGQKGFEVVNATGYQEIYSQLVNNCKFWYYSGNNTLNESGSQAEWDMLFTKQNYWRAYGDYEDTQGSSPENPDADLDHIVTANTTLEKWESRSEVLAALNYLPSTFLLLQEDYGASTFIPEYLMAQGAVGVIADLKRSELGYSEHLAYLMVNELLKSKPIGEALVNALSQMSHIYSENLQGTIIGATPFSNFTEESQMYILYGDPELVLINKTFNLVKPTSYRPLIHGFSNITRRTGFEFIGKIGNTNFYNTHPAEIWANITDLDSILKTEVTATFNVTGTDYGAHESFQPYQTNRPTAFDDVADKLFEGYTIFFNTSLYLFESLTRKTVEWQIVDQANVIHLQVPIYLRSALPDVVDSSIQIQLNDTGVFNDIDHVGPLEFHERIGRVNESIYIKFNITDVDQDSGILDSTEFQVYLLLRNLDTNATGLVPMDFVDDLNEGDIKSSWKITYQFDALNDTGLYWLYAQIIDGENETVVEPLDYIYLDNWPAEPNGTNFVTTNGTGIEHQVFRETQILSFTAAVFDVDGVQTHVQNVSMCFYKAPNQWINVSMGDSDLNNNWTGTHLFTKYNVSGVWNLFVKVTDKDNLTVLLDPKVNITIANHLPNLPTNVTIIDFNGTTLTSILRNNSLQLTGNATDIDIINRTADLTLFACLRDAQGIVRYQEVMIYNYNTSLWEYNFTPLPTDPIGNWTYYVSVVDEAGGRTNSTNMSLMILNNIPVIKSVTVYPVSTDFYFKEPLSLTIYAEDVEQLANITVFIEDEEGNRINATANLTGQLDSTIIQFQEEDYATLKTSGEWNITILLVDMDGSFTGEFTFGTQSNSIVIIVHPPTETIPFRFPFEVIIIIAIIVIAVLATYLVYRVRKKEAVVVPAARVKQIIRKLSKEREGKIAEEKAELQAKIKAIDITPKPKVTIKPGEIQELSEEVQEKLNKEMRDNVKNALKLLEEGQFEAGAAAYHDAAMVALKLQKKEIAKVYIDRSKEILAKKEEMKAERKKKLKQAAKEEKVKRKERAKKRLRREEIENIKAEIGDLMRIARKAIRDHDFITAAKQYREVASLYRKLGDEEKALEFEERAGEL